MSENTEDNTSNALASISNEYTSALIGVTKTASHNLNDVDDTPRIICNELLVGPQKRASIEKLDELSSLEREIAKMHHVEDETDIYDSALMATASTTLNDNQIQMSTTHDNDLSNEDNAKNVKSNDLVKTFEEKLEEKLDAITSGETALEHEDLIAVLKGLDNSTTDDTHNNSCVSVDPVLEDGVTIEGEGEYQIMEVIDDDSNAEDATKSEANTTDKLIKSDDIKSEPNTTDESINEDTTKSEASTTDQSINKKKTYGANLLTTQEERALALEQMEVLKVRPKQKAKSRRKQDIKPIKEVDTALDLVSALEAEWSENDDDVNNEKPSTSEVKTKLSIPPSTTSATTSKTTSDIKSNTPLITSVVVIPTQVQTTAVAITTTSTTANTTNTTSSSTEDKVPTNTSSPAQGVVEKSEEIISTHTGFRRTRIIKRKIIWDPDAPETTFSYAKLVKPNANNTKTKTETIPTTTITKGSTTITPIKKENVTATTTVAKKIIRPTTPKDKKLSTDLNIEKKVVTKPNTVVVTKTIIAAEDTKSTKKTEESGVTKTKAATSSSAEEKTSTSPITTTRASTNSPVKRRSQTPVTNGPGGAAGVKKKKITEIDRLMGDEGAVNMLNSLEKLEATIGGNEAKPTRPMMRSRAATICEKVPRKENKSPAKTTSPNTTTTNSPTTTTTTPTKEQTNKGKRTNKSRASSTWDYVYKKNKQDFDDSLIIRRRSNSSYSSTTSLNRSSLDGPPSAINNSNSTASKTNNTKSSPAYTSPTSSSTTKTPPSSSNLDKSVGSSKGNSTSPSAGKSFEFAKPENKKTQKRTKSPAATLANDMKKSAPAAGKRTTTTTSDDNKDVKTSTKSPPISSSLKDRKDSTPSPGTVSDVVVKKSSKVAQIIFNTNKAKLSNTFTIQMLNKLVDILDKLASDPDCHVVVMATNDAHFCQGVDITELTRTTGDKRKNYAGHLATAVKNYLKTLATYPKPLVAGINGSIMNLGVIQLALFDIVIAGDKTTFETPYVKMGQPPEGFSIWNNMSKIRGSFKTKIFWLCERIQSTEAALAGLVNKLTSANKVNEEALIAAKRIASYSAESYRAMKKTITSSHLDVIATSLDEEFETIIKQWTSSECLENMKKYVDQGHY